MGDIVNLEAFTRQRMSDPYGVLADLKRREDELVARLEKLILGRPSRRADYIAAHAQEWVAQGAQIQATRERAGVSRTALARVLGVSAARIARLEMGLPVRDARLLRAAVIMYLEKHV
ncbi:hypothetical protein PTH_2499 [Pelotomaculum thermopropionicum SI]|uniref:HTH cro/C1-type domain-containing protein n=1 Tax=Pelotomaculum thermopropionicum (strain DSM 13744 / JCM 10971 / SI) TaxID=370438 RepID=A5CZB1_PELTS|nr:hypothetical protein PTH_2499 [Pelotomaculum thermopropionicum SI]